MADEIRVDGTDFILTADGQIAEWGTSLRYDPATGRGYQLDNGVRVALTSYEAFGADFAQSRKAAERWIEKARKAWDALN